MVEVIQDVDRRVRGFPPGHKYGEPCKCKQITGEKRLRYVQPPRTPSYAPVKVYRPPDAKIPDKTTYSLSFEAFDPKVIRACKGTPTYLKENLTTAGSFSGLTTHKMSYGAWPGIKRDRMVYPRDHKLMGDGPISSITTNKHDYTPKPIDTLQKILPHPSLGFSREPMEKNSTMGLSYQCPDYTTFESPLSFKPQVRYMPPSSPIDSNTVHKLSFLPWEPTPKQDLPWVKKDAYVAPRIPLDGTTIYNGSYIAPGKVVEDGDGHCKGCYCIYPMECADDVVLKEVCPSSYNPKTDPPRPPPRISMADNFKSIGRRMDSAKFT